MQAKTMIDNLPETDHLFSMWADRKSLSQHLKGEHQIKEKDLTSYENFT